MQAPKVRGSAAVMSTREVDDICSQQENTEKYDWHFPHVLDKPIPVDDVAKTIRLLLLATQQLHRAYPRWTNDQVRENLKRNNTIFQTMADTTHPHLFLMLTDRKLSQKNLRHIQDLLSIRKAHEESPDSLEDNTLEITGYFSRNFWGNLK